MLQCIIWLFLAIFTTITESSSDNLQETVICPPNTDCNIICNQTNSCQGQQINCNQEDYKCNIICNGTSACYSTNIVSYSYNFSLSCQSDRTCYDIFIQGIRNGKTNTASSANIYCPVQGSCQYSQLEFININQVNMNCGAGGDDIDDSNCFNTHIALSNVTVFGLNCIGYDSCYGQHLSAEFSGFVTLNCIGHSSCNYIDIAAFNNVKLVDISCHGSNACVESLVNVTDLNLTCKGEASCNSMTLSCNIHQEKSCDIACGDDSGCQNVYIHTIANHYTQYFVYPQPAYGYNELSVICHSPFTNEVIHITKLFSNSYGDNSWQCEDNICCPLLPPPTLKNVHCKEGGHCDVYCGPDQNYTGCGIINASEALSLDLNCEYCVVALIICPKSNTGGCNINCNAMDKGEDDIDGGCFSALIETHNDSYVNLSCLSSSFAVCSNINLDASNVKHISIECENCYGLNVIVPKFHNSSHIKCKKTSIGCNNMTLTVDQHYEYEFVTASCEIESCGTVNFNCSDHISSYMEMYGDKPWICSNWKCCPLTHKSIYCDTYDKVGKCVINCGGNSYDDNTTILCASQYIHNANQVNCIGLNGTCNAMNVFCPDNECEINCQKFGICNDIYIESNLTKQLDVNCGKQSCQNMIIYKDNRYNENHWNISCIGYQSCDEMTVNAPNSKYLSINCDKKEASSIWHYGACFGINIDATNSEQIHILSVMESSSSSMLNAIIKATNATNLTLQCIANYGGTSCHGTSLYVAKRNSILSQQYNYFFNIISDKAYITNEQVNISINYCQLCDPADYYDCQTNFGMKCGSNYSVFNGSDCSNDACCHDDMFNVINNYDECVDITWVPMESDILFYFGLSISGILLLVFVLMVFEFIYHLFSVRKYHSYKVGFKPPLFILRYIHIIDFMIHITIIYIILCFILSTVDIDSYCHSKYPSSAISPVMTLCDDDAHCNTELDGFGPCIQDNTVEALAIISYLLIGLYSICILCIKCGQNLKRGKNVQFDEESFLLRYWQFIGTIWNDEIITNYYNIKYFGLNYYKAHQTRWVGFVLIFGLAISANYLTGFYHKCVWLAVYPVMFSYCVIWQLLKLYYRYLLPYNEISIIEYILLKHFGNDIGTVVISFLDFNWSRKDFMNDTKHTKLLSSQIN